MILKNIIKNKHWKSETPFTIFYFSLNFSESSWESTHVGPALWILVPSPKVRRSSPAPPPDAAPANEQWPGASCLACNPQRGPHVALYSPSPLSAVVWQYNAFETEAFARLAGAFAFRLRNYGCPNLAVSISPQLAPVGSQQLRQGGISSSENVTKPKQSAVKFVFVICCTVVSNVSWVGATFTNYVPGERFSWPTQLRPRFGGPH